jgi:hypothetical protein
MAANRREASRRENLAENKVKIIKNSKDKEGKKNKKGKKAKDKKK